MTELPERKKRRRRSVVGENTYGAFTVRGQLVLPVALALLLLL